MGTTINEKVEVLARFGSTIEQIVPSRFKWHDKEFNVQKASKYRYRNGDEVVYVFSGTDGLSSFELDFNLNDFTWVLRKIWNKKIA